MISFLADIIGYKAACAAAFLVVFALTAVMTRTFKSALPQDQGRAFAVNGQLSKGKARGSGLIFVLCICFVMVLFLPVTGENLVYEALLIASMLSGYLDDASEVPWNEYKKGLIDFVIAAAAAAVFLKNNGSEIWIGPAPVTIPAPIYFILAIALVWASINAVNCTDGVDGLSASTAVVTIGTFLIAFGDKLGAFGMSGIIVCGSLLAYLWFNAKPSSILMGDAGSRAIGFFIAVLSMKSGHPFAFLFAGIVFVVDGLAGIIKISLKRFLNIWFLKNTLTPLHDHVRKRLGWSDEQVVLRWVILQAVCSAALIFAER